MLIGWKYTLGPRSAKIFLYIYTCNTNIVYHYYFIYSFPYGLFYFILLLLMVFIVLPTFIIFIFIFYFYIIIFLYIHKRKIQKCASIVVYDCGWYADVTSLFTLKYSDNSLFVCLIIYYVQIVEFLKYSYYLIYEFSTLIA